MRIAESIIDTTVATRRLVTIGITRRQAEVPFHTSHRILGDFVDRERDPLAIRAACSPIRVTCNTFALIFTHP